MLAAKLREIDPLAQAVRRGECVQGLGAVCSEVVRSARDELKAQALAGVAEEEGEGEEEDVRSSDEMRTTLAEKVRTSSVSWPFSFPRSNHTIRAANGALLPTCLLVLPLLPLLDLAFVRVRACVRGQEQLLERALDGALRAVHLRQLSNLRERALQTFRAGITATSHYEGLAAAEEEFTCVRCCCCCCWGGGAVMWGGGAAGVQLMLTLLLVRMPVLLTRSPTRCSSDRKGAEEATRPGAGWEFAHEKKALQVRGSPAELRWHLLRPSPLFLSLSLSIVSRCFSPRPPPPPHRQS